MSEQKQENLPNNIGKNQAVRDENGRFVKGHSGNPDGRPIGRENFSTIWWKFIEKIARQNEITTDEVDDQLIAVAFKKIKDGDYRFWKDIRDRIHGQATQNQNLNVQGNLTISQVLDALDGQETEEQGVENQPPLSDSEQNGQASSVQTQQDAS